jgi:hypothetical protein
MRRQQGSVALKAHYPFPPRSGEKEEQKGSKRRSKRGQEEQKGKRGHSTFPENQNVLVSLFPRWRGGVEQADHRPKSKPVIRWHGLPILVAIYERVMDVRTDPPEKRVPDCEETSEEKPRWQFSLRGLFLMTTIVAATCGLVAWWGVLAVLAMLGAATGAFLAALICPCIGCDVVLDDLRLDIVKCLGLGAYLVGGTWGMVVGVKWLVTMAWGMKTPVFISGGLILLFVFTVGLVAKLLWSDIDKVEAVVITFGSLIGSFAILSLCAGR